jgi:hypothetical protein
VKKYFHLCANRPIRQDYLDQFVWDEIIRLLEDPTLIQSEIDRRRAVAQNSDPFRVEKKIRRHLAKARERRGFGWQPWSREWLYGALGLLSEYRVSYGQSLSAVAPVE